MQVFDTDKARDRFLDFTGFAQEFLRRNSSYRQQYAALGDLAASEPFSPKCREMARIWGLSFPNWSGRIS